MKIAVIATVWFPLSHADVIVTRWVRPFFSDAACGWTSPASSIVSAYIEQRPANDLGVRFCAENGISLFETVGLALTLNTETLAVDGVLLIGEHGDYPRNEFGQKLYPRKRLFDEIVKVFHASGRAVPVFNDKHFSWDFTESGEMLATAEALGFPLAGGSSLPHCPLRPPVSIVEGRKITESVALFFGVPEDYGFHSMEFLQAILEKWPGGRGNVRAVRYLEGEAVRRAVAAGEVPEDLLLEALACHGYPATPALLPFVLERADEAVLFQIAYVDGPMVWHLSLPRFVSNWVAAWRLDSGEICSSQVDGGKGAPDFFANFAYLNVQLEEFLRTGIPPTPPRRTHFVGGVLQAVLRAASHRGEWVDTPELVENRV